MRTVRRNNAHMSAARQVLPLSGRRAWWLVAVLLGVQLALGYASAWNKSPVYDEPAHLFAGYSYLRTGDFRLMPSHPPLAEMLAAAPLLTCEANLPDVASPDSPAAGEWDRGAQYRLATRWLYHCGNNPDRILRLARAPMLLLTALGGLGLYLITRRGLGTTGGLIALVLYAFSPSMLAHARWVTTDLPVAVFFLLATYSFWRLTACLSVGRFAAAALWTSALFVTKFSAVLFVPVAVLLVALRVALRWELGLSLGRCRGRTVAAGRRARRAAYTLVACAALGVVVVAAIWACHGFRYLGPRADGFHYAVYGVSQFQGTADQAWHRLAADRHGEPAPGRRVVLWAARHRLLPEAYLYGLLYTLKSAESRFAYLRGRISTVGWWYYFPYVFAVKTPLPLPLLCAVGAAGWIAYARSPQPQHRRAAGELLWPAVIFLAVYALASLTSSLNIGHRHLLPVYPFLFVLAAGSTWWIGRAQGRVLPKVLVALLLVCHAGASLRTYPHYLPYFNVLAGGPTHGWRYLSDSNIDWGQDLIHLRRHLDAHPELVPPDRRLKLAYFGTADPEYYLGPVEHLPSWPFMPDENLAEVSPGLYAVSVTQLTELYLFELGPWSADHQRRLEALLAARRDVLSAGDDPEALAHAVRRHRQSLAELFPPETREAFLRDPDLYAQFFDALAVEADRTITDLRFLQLVIYLRGQEPLARVGHSIYLYHLSDQDLGAATATRD